MIGVMERLEGRATISVEEAAEILGISRRAAYEAAHRYLAGDPDGLPVLKFGRRFVVPVPRFLEMLGTPDPQAGVVGPAREEAPGWDGPDASVTVLSGSENGGRGD